MALENILKKIGEDAASEIGQILLKASEEVGKIDKEREEALLLLQEGLEKEKISANAEIKNSIVLPAKLKVRGARLGAKQDLVDSVFRKALDFSDADYLKVLEYLAKDIPKIDEGEVYPAKGKEDIIRDFIKKKGFKVEFAKPLDEIVGGFVLKSGKIEYDCSFKTLLGKLRDKLETEIAELL